MSKNLHQAPALVVLRKKIAKGFKLVLLELHFRHKKVRATDVPITVLYKWLKAAEVSHANSEANT